MMVYMAKNVLDALIDKHGDVIYRFCLKLTRSRNDADDLYQETFLKALEHHNKINDNMNPRGYLLSICVNLWRSNRRKYMNSTVSLDELEDTALADAGFDVEDYVLAREQAQIVDCITSALDNKYRIPLYLYYTAGLSVAEIAKAMKIPKGTVKSRLFKARALVQKRLEVEKYEY